MSRDDSPGVGNGAVEFRILGPFEALRGADPIALGSYKQRSLLTLLLLHANEVVSTDRIIDELWGDATPEGAQNTLWVHVSSLRSALEPDRPKRSEGNLLLTRQPGYVLRVDPEQVDARRFERLASEGAALLEENPAAAAAVLRQALELWRGPALDDFTYESFAQHEIARLTELRLKAVEDRIEADLETGGAGGVIGELESLIRLHPLRERLTGLLMKALYRTGRQADALRAFGRLRTRLVDELGMEPSQPLRSLEERMLGQDASLEPPAEMGRVDASVRPRPGVTVRGYELRRHVGPVRMGDAYLAYQPALGRQVVVTAVPGEIANHPDFVVRFESEASAIARLEHPRVVPLYDYWREPGAAFLVERWLEGGSLEARLAESRPSPAVAVGIIEQIAEGLDAAHRRGLVHGGLQPATVGFDDEGNAYVTGFAVVADLFDAEGPSLYEAPEIVNGSTVTVRTDVYALGRIAQRMLNGEALDVRPDREEHPAANGSPAELPPAVSGVIERATRADPEGRFSSAGAFAEAFHLAVDPSWTPVGSPGSETVARNPYKGLRAFQESDATHFFGRERLVERLLVRLSAGSEPRMLSVVGPSGSGKSSVVNAGLVPALRRGALPGSDLWSIVDMHPGTFPFDELASALLRVAVDKPADLLEMLETDRSGLVRAVEAVFPNSGGRLVLIVDQFEELFTLVTDEHVRVRFLESLAEAVTREGGRIVLVVTLRADFYDRPLQYNEFGDLLRRTIETVTPLGPHELERAIVAPAAGVGVGFEQGTAAEIIADVVNQPGSLPLLQYALTELFDERSGSTITSADYEAIGGVGGALARRSEQVYLQLDPAQREAARNIFLRLVAVGGEGETTRRRVSIEELRNLLVESRHVDAVLAAYGKHRMLTFDRDQPTRAPIVEVAHEALLEEWPRLKQWISDAGDDLRLRRRLAEFTRDWVENARDPSYLPMGEALARLEAWSVATDVALTAEEQDLLDESLKRRQEQEREETARAEREAELRRRARSRLVAVISAIPIVLLVVGLAVFAFVQRSEANDLAAQQSRNAEARRLAAASFAVIETDPELSMLLALHAVETSAAVGSPVIAGAEEAVHWAIQGARIQYPVSDVPAEARFGPNGVTGIFRMPLADLVELARGAVTRSLTDDECATYLRRACPQSTIAAPLGRAAPAYEFAFSDEVNRPGAADKPLQGTSVILVHTAPRATLQPELERFTEMTGIEVILSGITNLEDEVGRLQAEGETFDLVDWPQPANVGEQAAAGWAMDLSVYLDVERLRAEYGDYLVDLYSFDGGDPSVGGQNVFAVPTTASVKSLVWYPNPEFYNAGYTVPDTWDELIGLSDRMVTEGQTPWCIGVESGGFADGWVATDWVEDILLRTAGAEQFERWVAHEIPFDHPDIKAAVEQFGVVAFGDGYVRGGHETIGARHWVASAIPLLTDPPGCWLHRQATFITGFFPSNVPDDAVGAFPFPRTTADQAESVLVGISATAASTDRPEVRELVKYMASGEWGTAMAQVPNGGFLAANARFDTALYNDERSGPVAEQFRAAQAADRLRFDADDRMPPQVQGAFWAGLVEYLESPEELDRILADIEALWSDLEEET